MQVSSFFTHLIMDTTNNDIHERRMDMDKIGKALLATALVVVILIGLPILIALLGVIWPVLLVLAILIFIPILVGIGIGSESRNKEDR